MIHSKVENIMRAMVVLDRHPYMSKSGIMSELSISRATAMRVLQYARALNVKIKYDRNTMKYHIISWGVFDKSAVYKWCRKAGVVK